MVTRIAQTTSPASATNSGTLTIEDCTSEASQLSMPTRLTADPRLRPPPNSSSVGQEILPRSLSSSSFSANSAITGISATA